MKKNSTNSQSTFSEAVNQALDIALEIDDKVICYGLGVDDPKRIFGTTFDLQEKYGKHRVFDIPTSENALTGVAVGASIGGYRPIMVHQRLDFFLLALDQLVNNAAKYYYTFNGKSPIPLTIRLILGRGWGQGPTHSQNLHAWFSHIPGIKVVMPTFPEDAKGLLLASIFDNNPVIFIEHRWLHSLKGFVPIGDNRIEIGLARKVFEGNDLTIVSMSYMTIEALLAVKKLKKINVNVELIDLRTIKPVDWSSIFSSVRKTGKLLVLDTGSETSSFAGEIITRVCKECWNELLISPERITMPDCPEPTSYGLTRNFYPTANTIIARIIHMLKLKVNIGEIAVDNKTQHDVPGDWFKGPF
tara:strand:- start:4859 stop:5932 length:1074 start_codon:yes stop_codon:yes gene_type:complete